MSALVYLGLFAVFILIFLVVPLALLSISLAVGGLAFFKNRHLGLAILLVSSGAPVGCLCGVSALFLIPQQWQRILPFDPFLLVVSGPVVGIAAGILLTAVSWMILGRDNKPKTAVHSDVSGE